LYCIHFKNTENQTPEKNAKQLIWLFSSYRGEFLFPFHYIHILNEEKIE